jgi:hypothetical protein
MSPSRWTTGANQVERLLGKELLVLAWAVERANPEMIPNALRNWTGLRPEERWWLFNITAAATGTSDDTDVGWRKALRFALCDNPLSEPTHKTSTRQQLLGRSKPLPQMTIFSEFSEEPSPFLPAPKSSSKLQEDSL